MRPDSIRWDAVIVGSGPAGASAALPLARAGQRILILEKESWPRYKTCGGGLVWRARRELDVDLDTCIEREARRAELRLDDGELAFSVVRDKPLVTMTMRSALDQTLTAAAVEAGAEMRPAARVSRLRTCDDHIEVTAGDRIHRGHIVIAADGAAGSVATLAGWPALRSIPALESEIEVDSATHDRFAGIARFDFPGALAGYAWVFPKRTGLSVGCLSRDQHRPKLRAHLDSYLERLGIRPTARNDHGFVIPVAPRDRQLARGRILLTGDTAGLADPVTCEGISNAILSGQLAARAILAGGTDPRSVTALFQDSLDRSILRELRLARRLAWLLYETSRLRRFAFRRLGAGLSEAMAEIIAGDRTYRELVTTPSSYRRLLGRLLRAPGTYPKG